MTERMKIRNASQSVSKEDLRQLLLAVLEGADDVEKPKETPIEHGEIKGTTGDDCGIQLTPTGAKVSDSVQLFASCSCEYRPEQRSARPTVNF